MDQDQKRTLLLFGLGVMVGAAAIFIFKENMSGRQIWGVCMLFIIGFGMTIAGSPDPNKKEN